MHYSLILYNRCSFGRNRILRRGTFSFEAEIIFRQYLVPYFIRIAETAHRRQLHSHTLQPLLVWPESVSNEGHFPIDEGTLFRPCLASPCNRMNDSVSCTPYPYAKPVLVCPNIVNKEGHFTHDDTTDFSPYLVSHCNRMTDTKLLALLSQTL
jgi:hypothetical protein